MGGQTRTAVASALLSALLLFCAMRCQGQAGGPRVLETADRYRVDGERALGYVRDIVAFGPRHPGAPGAEKTRRYILEKLRSFGLKPVREDFVALTPKKGLERVAMANIRVDIPGGSGGTVLLGGHFDGKMIDGVRFVGANDGGSSTALLLEIARVLGRTAPPCPVRIAFFDGEEALVAWSDSDSLYGSKQMAAEMRREGRLERVAAAVVVDMIGDKNLRISREESSSPGVFGVLEATAERLGEGALFDGPVRNIEDDHAPFLQIGIPAAVLIDLDFGPGWESNAYWHTAADTPDKLSAGSLEAVGRVVLESLPALSALTR